MCKNWGLVAEFDNPGALLEAAHKVQVSGYRKSETWSPFPIHGMDDAQGLGAIYGLIGRRRDAPAP